MAFCFYNRLRAYAQKHQLISPIEVLAKSYNSPAVGVIFALVFVCFIVPGLALQLVAIGFFLENLSGGAIGYLNGVGLMVSVVLLYVVLGGMRAVAYTDALQSLLMLAGLIGGLFIVAGTHWGGVSDMVLISRQLIPAHWTFAGPKGLYTPLFFFSLCLMMAGVFVRPEMATRAMMAGNKRQINWLFAAMALSLVFVVAISFLYGIAGVMLYPNLGSGNQLMGQMFLDISQLGSAGMICAALFILGAFGAAMSTSDSMLLAAAQLLVRDVLPTKATKGKIREVVLARLMMATILGGLLVWG